MGKPFTSELTRLPATLRWASDFDVTGFQRFIAQAHGHPLLVIGAGGSFTVAEFARLLHEAKGNSAVAHTPLGFLQSESDMRQAYVVIFTASGGNRDILAVYDAAAAREPRGILIVCGKRNSKVEQRAGKDERTEIFVAPLPAGKDGYLATNSLVAFIGLILRAFGADEKELARLARSADTFSPKALGRAEVTPYFLALFGGWGRPAATDLESKLSEAGLAGVMLADYRNFAHGRHNWIDKRGDASTVVAFITPDSEALAKKTLALLPESTRILRLTTDQEGGLGALALLLQVFDLTAAVGRGVGIDPGRPGVPTYGRRIYHLGPVIDVGPHNAREAAIQRKLAARNSLGSQIDQGIVATAHAKYLEILQEGRFGALVIDYDGTVVRPGAAHDAKLSAPVVAVLEKLLRADIPLYFATGRGDSIHPVLTKSIDQKFHSLVSVSYYNGAVTSRLTEPPPTPEAGGHHQIFAELLEKLNADPVFGRATQPSNKGFQLTLRIQDQSAFALAAGRIRETVLAEFAMTLRVVESSHSLDVIPRDTTKLNCVRLAQTTLGDSRALTVGDRGALSGNDYDLLSHPYSLSVDAVSSSLTSCWNLLPCGVRNVSGLLHLAKWFRMRRGTFGLTIA